ncbi:MAG: sugar phosphate nucleotidyltransferase [Bdellovibrionales bacterium]
MNAMILAAGYGRRLEPVTKKIPKPAVEFLNIPLLFYAAQLLEALKPDRVVVNCHHLPEQIEALAIEIAGPKRRVEISYEEEKILGSGGGIKYAETSLIDDGPFIVLNADNVILPHRSDFLVEMMEYHRKHEPLSTVLLVPDARVGTEFNGIWTNNEFEVCEITKKPTNKNLKGFHFSGIQIFDERIFEYLPDGESNIFQDAILPAIADGEKVLGFTSPLQWFETGDRENFLKSTQQAMQILAEGKSSFLKELIESRMIGINERKSIWEPTNDISSRTIPGQVLIGENCDIDPSVKLVGSVVIGNDVMIGPNAIIEDSVILSHSKVPSGTTLQAAIYC